MLEHILFVLSGFCCRGKGIQTPFENSFGKILEIKDKEKKLFFSVSGRKAHSFSLARLATGLLKLAQQAAGRPHPSVAFFLLEPEPSRTPPPTEPRGLRAWASAPRPAPIKAESPRP